MNDVRKLAYAAILLALAVVLSFFTINFGQGLQFGISEAPIMYTGFFLGPIYGSLVGLLRDVFTMLRLGYPPSLFTLAPIALGLIPGLALKFFGSKKLYNSLGLIFVVILVTTLTRTMINAISLHYVIGLSWKSVLISLPPKLLAILIEGGIYSVLFHKLLPITERLFIKK